MEQGRKEGREEGREEGRKEGKGEGKKELLIELGIAKFGELPPWAEEKLHTAPEEQLGVWSKSILLANTLEEWLGS